MFTVTDTAGLSVTARYAALHEGLGHLVDGEPSLIANLANASSLIYHTLPDLNWAGFYLFDGGELVLGPFQGKPACIRIAIGRGVCGTAAAERRTIVVRDVHEFPGHIACDAASRSEVVVPMMKGNALIGVLDLDSPLPGRFTDEDGMGLEEVVRIILGQLS